MVNTISNKIDIKMPAATPSGTSVRMFVLETDEPHPDTTAARGSFGDIFNELFTTAGKNHDPPLGIETDMHYVVESNGGVVPSLQDFEGFRAVLITGSMFDAHGDDPWILKLLEVLRGKLDEACYFTSGLLRA